MYQISNNVTLYIVYLNIVPVHVIAIKHKNNNDQFSLTTLSQPSSNHFTIFLYKIFYLHTILVSAAAQYISFVTG